jgi:replicative DNA helicase
MSTSSFHELGKPFQEKIMQAMIIDRKWAENFIEVFDPEEAFEFSYLKLLGKLYVNYYNSYKEFPSLDMTVTLVKDELKQNVDIALKTQIIEFLKKVALNKDLGDLGYVKDKAQKFCKQQKFKNALFEASELVEDETQYESALNTMKKAIFAGTSTSPGLEYNTEIDVRYSETYRKTIKTGIAELDGKTILNGGLGAGEIGIIVAPSGHGKSQILVQLGSNALLQGKNVVFYTLELNERVIGIRFDSSLTQISSTDCPEHKDKIKSFFDQNSNLGKLIIKHFPARTTTVNTLRSHLDKLRMKEFIPDLILIDYAGIMRSTSKNELLRKELQEVIQECRDLGEELDVPVWTALQSNKDGVNSEFVDITNMSESFGQAAPADFILGWNRKSAEKSTGYGNLFIAKNRAGIDGILLKAHLDTARSTLRILKEDELQEFQEQQSTIEKTDSINHFKSVLKKHAQQFTRVTNNE